MRIRVDSNLLELFSRICMKVIRNIELDLMNMDSVLSSSGTCAGRAAGLEVDTARTCWPHVSSNELSLMRKECRSVPLQFSRLTGQDTERY